MGGLEVSMKLTCRNCETEFEGRSNRKYCSPGCRRAIELRRRNWDEAQGYATFWDNEAQNSETEARAAAHREQADRIRKRAGPTRP